MQASSEPLTPNSGINGLMRLNCFEIIFLNALECQLMSYIDFRILINIHMSICVCVYVIYKAVFVHLCLIGSDLCPCSVLVDLLFPVHLFLVLQNIKMQLFTLSLS